MNFEQFKNSRRFVDSIGSELSDEMMEATAGFVYADSFWIGQFSSGEFFLMIGCEEFLSQDLGKLESILWDFASDEINVGQPETSENNGNSLIKNDKRAMDSVKSVLKHHGIKYEMFENDDFAIDAARKFSARCRHEWDRPYRGHGTRKCGKCGALQDN